MFDNLKLKLQIFLDQEIKIIQREQISSDVYSRIPQKWSILSNLNYSTAQIIENLWEDVSSDGADFIEVLKNKITNLVFITSINNDFIKLGYVFNLETSFYQDDILNCWVAEKPFVDYGANLDREKSIPDSYYNFCKIHNGFLYNSNPSIGFLPLGNFYEINLSENQKKLLGFCGDGYGNMRCFNDNRTNNFDTVDWDHENQESSDPLPFWEFAHNFLLQNMPDE